MITTLTTVITVAIAPTTATVLVITMLRKLITMMQLHPYSLQQVSAEVVVIVVALINTKINICIIISH